MIRPIRISSLYSKFTLSFLIVCLVIGASISTLFYFHNRTETNTTEKQRAYHLILDLEQSYTFAKEFDSRNEDLKKKFSDQIDDFHVNFDNLISKKLREKIAQSDSVEKDVILSELSSEDQLLYFSQESWEKIRKNANTILYNDIVYDSLYNQMELKEKWHQADSSIKYLPIINSKSKKVLTDEGRVAFRNISTLIKRLEGKLWDLHEIYDARLNASHKSLTLTVVLAFIINLLTIFAVYRYLGGIIFKPLKLIQVFSTRIVQGNMDISIEYPSKDEYFDLIKNLTFLKNDIKGAQDFIEHLNFDHLEETKFLDEGEKSTLKRSLIDMKDKLSDLAIKENQRNWTIEGQAIFSEILSKHSSDFDYLSDEIIHKLVEYTGALQGGLFIVSKDEEEREFLELASCFAYDRKKFISNKIDKGEGIVGQVWQERKKSFITDLPEDHMVIKSGLGSQAPSCLLVVPLIENEIIYGVLELASFDTLAQHKIDFIEKIAENIATTLSTVETNKRTQILLSESQDLTLKMKEQEEEMLQNLEELQATQEEMRRRELQKENELKEHQEQSDKRLEENEARENALKQKITDLQEEVINAASDNENIRELKKELEENQANFDSQLSDLQETIRIKDMRIAKLRKRLDKPS